MRAEGKIDDCTEAVLKVHDELHQQWDNTKQALQLVAADTMAQQQAMVHADTELCQLASATADCGNAVLEMNEEIAKQWVEKCAALQDVAKDS